MPHVILDRPQASIEVSGALYPVSTDFKDWLDFSILLARLGKQPPPEALLEALALVLREIPLEIQGDDLADALLAFLRNEEPKPPAPDRPQLMRDTVGTDREAAKAPRVLDYEHDGGLIFAAFMQAYGVNLAEASLHWHHFLALLDGLPDNVLLRKVMAWRSATPSDLAKMSKAEAEHVRKMQRIWALPDTRTQDEIDADFAAAF